MAYIVNFYVAGEPDNMLKLRFDTLEEAQHSAKMADENPAYVFSHISEIIEIHKVNQNPVEKVDLKSMQLVSQVMLGNYYGEIELHRFHDNYFITLNNWDHDNGRLVTKEFAEAFMREFGRVK